MAIDGINIIDSDLAHDIYIGITDGWKNHQPLDSILNEILSSESSHCDDEVYYDIYWTTLAYSLWKIGHLSDDILQKVMTLVEQGASEQWAIVADDNQAPKKRQKVLEKLLQKIQTPNPKPIKQYSQKTKSSEPYFNIGDVVVIKYPEPFKQGYGAFLVVDIEQSIRKKEYHFAVVRYFDTKFPTLDDILMCDILFRGQIGFDSSCWFSHKALTPLLPYFKKIANVQLITNKMGCLSPANDLEDFYQYVDKNDINYGGKTKQVVDVVKAILEQT